MATSAGGQELEVSGVSICTVSGERLGEWWEGWQRQRSSGRSRVGADRPSIDSSDDGVQGGRTPTNMQT